MADEETPAETPAEEQAPAEKAPTEATPDKETPAEEAAADDANEGVEVPMEEAPAKEESASEDAKKTDPSAPSEEKEESGIKKEWIFAGVFLVVVTIIVIVVAVLLAKDDDSQVSPATAGEADDTVIPDDDKVFNRIATFPVCMQLDDTCNTDVYTNAEEIYATEDGMKILYTDTETSSIGLVDISDPANPLPFGTVPLPGAPTDTIVFGNYAVVSINTSPNHVNTSGELLVIDLATSQTVRTIDLGGQPEGLAISPDKSYIVAAIENQRDDDVNDGDLPQLPAGFLIVVNSSNPDPTKWTYHQINLTGLGGVGVPRDPEPETVAINENNLCVVTLQENNSFVLVELGTLEVIFAFSAGTVDLEDIDIDDEGLISLGETEDDIPREPDGVAWINNDHFVSADEGDYKGGSRGFTIFEADDDIVYTSGNELDYWAIRIGHYPELRSDNKGNEPEKVLFAQFAAKKLVFVTSERANLVFVYEVSFLEQPQLLQTLPTGVVPHGMVAIPSRDLLIVSNDYDYREEKYRSNIMIYQRQDAEPDYPTLVSVDKDELPVAFSSLSALASSGDMLYTVEDSFYIMSRIFAIDTTTKPYTIVNDMRLLDTSNALSSVLSEDESSELVRPDKLVNLDLEGIDVIDDGGFWVVSEGRGIYNDTDSPFETPNLLIRLDEDAVIEETVRLPMEVEEKQDEFGFHGVAVNGDMIAVAFGRAWQGELHPRIGIYNATGGNWTFVFYPLDSPTSQNGGWVELSDITSLGDGKFVVVERDNQGGPDASLKRLYTIDLGDYSSLEEDVIEKTLVRDLIPDLSAATNGPVVEKVEGVAVDDDGNVWIINDNNGVDENSGENLLLNLGAIL